MIIVSACLCGVKCRYNVGSNLNNELQELVLDCKAIALCPEVLGGLETPRTQSEVVSSNPLKILTKTGSDVTDEFMLGAKKTLEIAKTLNASIAILKSKSPSCGCGEIYDGTFTKKLISGNGVTANLLKYNGITIYNEHNFSEPLKKYLSKGA